MRRTTFFGLAALVAVAAAGAGIWAFSAPPERPLAPREAAEKLLSDCQWSAASEACTALLAKTPNDGELWFWRGRARLALGEFAAAVGDLTEAITRLPQDAEPRYFRAMAHARLDQIELADADFAEARRLDPNQDKHRLAVRDEEAARELQAAVRDATRSADERSARRLSAQMSRAEAQTAAMRDAGTTPLPEENRTAITNQSAVKGAEPSIADHQSRALNLDSAFDKLTQASVSPSRSGPSASLPTTPDELTLSPTASAATPSAVMSTIGDPDALPANRLSGNLGSSQADTPAGTQSLNSPGESPDTPPESPRVPVPLENDPPLSAWEQFQRRRAVLSSVGPSTSTPPERSQTPFSIGAANREQPNDSDADEVPSPTSKYPVKSWTAPGESALAQVAPSGPLAARTLSGLPLSTALPSPFGPRGPENALSTAIAPLPAPVPQTSAAVAANPPGVLSMAMHELFAPQAGAAPSNARPPLATFTAPLPKWATSPEPIRAK